MFLHHISVLVPGLLFLAFEGIKISISYTTYIVFCNTRVI